MEIKYTYVNHFDILVSISRAWILFPVFPVQNGPPTSNQYRLRVASNIDHVPILVQFYGCNDHIARVYTDGCSSTIRLVALHAVDVNDPLLSVHLCDLAVTTLKLPPDDPDLVVFADR